VSLVDNLHARFEVSSSNRSRDMEGVSKFKNRSRDPIPTPFDLILFSLVPLVVNLLAKYKVSNSNRSRVMEGIQNLTSTGHVTPSRPL